MAPKKLTEDEAEEIRIDLREGRTFSEIANEWGISPALVQKINEGKNYTLEGFHYPVRPIKRRNDGLSMAGDDEED